MSFADDLSSIVALQGRDGGWGYRGGSSWTEPTVYALLAQAVQASTGESFARGAEWLRSMQRADGGWPPHPSVDQSTWVTALAVLLLAGRPDWTGRDQAVQWLLKQSGRESGWAQRLRLRLLGFGSQEIEQYAGWPWFPGTAAWVSPTALSILALEKVQRSWPQEAIRKRIETGREFLLGRMCQDGGWNHGSSKALGYEASSYPETTGLALLALHGAGSSRLGKSLAFAGQAYRSCRTAEGLSWLGLGLAAHGRTAAGNDKLKLIPRRNMVDAVLCMLAEAAAKGDNVFLS